jgi:hypothetical protein
LSIGRGVERPPDAGVSRETMHASARLSQMGKRVYAAEGRCYGHNKFVR